VHALRLVPLTHHLQEVVVTAKRDHVGRDADAGMDFWPAGV
jgi:hypothetical protein